MNNGRKLADLKALASSAVAEESSKAVSLLRKAPAADVEPLAGIPVPQILQASPAKTSKRPKESMVTRVPAVLRARDMKAISVAKIYLMQNGPSGVSTNNVIQVALRWMKVGPDLLGLLEEVLGEDGRRKQ